MPARAVVVITGSRRWDDEQTIRDRFIQLASTFGFIELHHGNAAGADKICDKVARELGFKVVQHIPNYAIYGRGAPLKRNTEMAEMDPKPIIGIAFRSDGKSNGTDHCIGELERCGIAVDIIFERRSFG